MIKFGKIVYGTHSYGKFYIGYESKDWYCIHIHFFVQKHYKSNVYLWGRHRELDIYYDGIFHKTYYFGRFFAITWTSLEE